MRLNGKKVDPLCHDQLPDPIGRCVAEFRAQIAELQERVARLEEEKKILEDQQYGTENHQSLQYND